MKIRCSNCMQDIDLDLGSMTTSFTTKAHGRGSKRVEAVTTHTPIWTEGDILLWEAPCCPDYGDSYDPHA